METFGYNSLTSWLILIPCTVIQLFLMSVMRLSGLFFVILLDGYTIDRQTASVPIVIYGALRTITGPLAAYLGETFGFRAVTLLGCILGSIGIGLCFFAESIGTAIICLGLIHGLGMSLGLNLIPTIVKHHFTEHINLVNGITLAGACMGSMILSPVITLLQKTYGMHGMFLILGGMYLNCIPAAMFLKHPHNDRRTDEESEQKDAKFSSQKAATYYQNYGYCLDDIQDEETKTEHVCLKQQKNEMQNPNGINFNGNLNSDNSGNKNNLKQILNTKTTYFPSKPRRRQTIVTLSPLVPEITLVPINRRNTLDSQPCKILKSENGALTKWTKTTDTDKTYEDKGSFRSFRLFMDPTFLFIMLAQSFHGFVTTLNWTIIVDYARDKGISNHMSVYFAMIIPFSAMIGFLCFNWITDRNVLSRTNFSLICFFILTLDTVFIVLTNDFALLAIGVFIFGSVAAAAATTFPGIIFEYIEEEQQTMAIASRYLLYAFLCVLKTPIIGYFRGTLGSYNLVYCIIMTCSISCCIFVKLTPVLASLRDKKKQSMLGYTRL